MKLDLPPPFFIPRLCIIGIGLIGGSLAQALKAAEAVGTVVASDSRIEALQDALALGVADEVFADPVQAVEGADVIILATPITAMGELMCRIMPEVKDTAVISDVGSTKGSVIAAVEKALGYLPPRFVPAHPIAGTEKHGVANSFATLFQQRRAVITPHVGNNHDAVVTVTRMWESVGSEVEEMGVKHHDQVLAATSHLPHLLAFSTVDTLANLDDRAEIFRFAAGGFRDFTRISTSDPGMWADICLQNKTAVLEVLHQFQKKLDVLEAALANGDRDTIVAIFQRAKHARDNFYHEM